MYKNLYDTFARWYHDNRGQVWLYSDPHFADEEMKHLRKNYIGDEEQVRRINSKVGKYDTLVILGDIGMKDWVRKLHGYHVLIMGNHDSGATSYMRHNGYIDRLNHSPGEKYQYVEQDNGLFDEIYEGPLFISPRIVLSHEPIDLPFAFNIHGHEHGTQTYKDDRHLNVCAEHIDYTPVCLKHVVDSGALKDIPTIHRIAIENQKKNKKTSLKKSDT